MPFSIIDEPVHSPPLRRQISRRPIRLRPCAPITSARRIIIEIVEGETAYPGVSSAISGHRYYDPELGRWLSRDPIGERGGLNVYGYCRNDALFLVDALGLEAEEVTIEGVGAGWAGWELTLQGKTELRLSGENFYVTGSAQPGMWTPESGSTSSLLIYKAANPNKVFRLDHHALQSTGGRPAWHYNTTKGFSKIEGLRATNHAATRGAAATGRTLTIFRWGGRAMFVVGAAMSAYDVGVCSLRFLRWE